MPTLAELLDDLFRTHRKPTGREYTYIEVCAALDGALEPSHLGKLRNGTIANPKRDTLVLLCRFLGNPNIPLVCHTVSPAIASEWNILHRANV